MRNYKIVVVGSKGSGKTLYLASMYNRLSAIGRYNVFLECDTNTIITDSDGTQKTPRQLLAKRYANLADPSKDWDAGTVDVEKWAFTCKVKGTQSPSIFSACEFTYLDYAGGDLDEQYNEELEKTIKDADCLLGLLDGAMILSVIRGESSGSIKLTQYLGNILPIMSRQTNPVQFIISKWDLFDGVHTLKEVKARLLQEDNFRDFIHNIKESQYRTIEHKGKEFPFSVRLIPVSSVGVGFAKLEDGKMIKNPGAILKPFQVEMPLACVLIDKIKDELQKVVLQEKEIESKKIDKLTMVEFWDSAAEFFGSIINLIRKPIVEKLPPEFRFTDDILKKIVEGAMSRAIQTREEQESKIRELERKRSESLKRVKDEGSSLEYAIDVFLELDEQLKRNFPDCIL